MTFTVIMIMISRSQCHNVTMSRCHDVTESDVAMLWCCHVVMLRCYDVMLRCYDVMLWLDIMKSWFGNVLFRGVYYGVYFCGVYLGYLCFLLHVIFAYFGIPWYFIWAPIEYHPLLVRVFCVVICACMFVSMYSFCYIPWKYRVLSTYLGMVYFGL